VTFGLCEGLPYAARNFHLPTLRSRDLDRNPSLAGTAVRSDHRKTAGAVENVDPPVREELTRAIPRYEMERQRCEIFLNARKTPGLPATACLKHHLVQSVYHHIERTARLVSRRLESPPIPTATRRDRSRVASGRLVSNCRYSVQDHAREFLDPSHFRHQEL